MTMDMAVNSSETFTSNVLSTTKTILHQHVSHSRVSVQETQNVVSSMENGQSLLTSSAHSSEDSSSYVSPLKSFIPMLQSSLEHHLSSVNAHLSSSNKFMETEYTSETPLLTSIQVPYRTTNLKIPPHSSRLTDPDDFDSVQLTSRLTPSSSSTISSSSFLPPIVPTTRTTTNGSVSSTSTPSGLTDNLTLILGISLCGLALVILLLIIMFVCCRKRSKAKHQTVETVQIGDLWANDRQDISFAPTFDSAFDTVSESPKTDKSNKSNKDVLYKVLYPFTAQDDTQLTLDLGDLVTLIEKRNNGWWKGKIREKEGWFPGSYVEEAEIGLAYGSHHPLHNGHSPVSSFLKDQDITPKLTKNNSNRNSAPAFTFDKKVLGKEVSIPKVPAGSPFLSPPDSRTTSPAHNSSKPVPSGQHNASYSHEKIYTENVEGLRFHALYSHVPNFSNELDLSVGDVVIGIERDMNGWMKGKKERSGDIGMFPAIYVQEITEADPPLGYQDKQSVYDQLPVCYEDTSTAEYIGVEHVAVCPYAAEMETDLSFDIGDTIVVCQTLDNGWWYGCHGDHYGWFPGSYVEMTEDDITGVETQEIMEEGEITHDNIPENTVIHDKPLETTIDKDIAALSPIKPHGGNKSEDEISLKSTDSVEKRSKIPKTVPKDSPSKRSKLPTAVRPSRPAPPPPGQHHSTPESKTNLMDKFNKAKDNNGVLKNKGNKPEVPKRFIKPKLRKVPKMKTRAGNESELCRRKVRSPPPPRPELPKLLREKYSINRNQNNVISTGSPNLFHHNDSTCDISVQEKTEDDINDGNKVNKDNNESIPCDSSQYVTCDSQNMTSFLENTTDTSIGKISGLTSLSSSVQGERTHDQSELTSVSAINMSDMNDSKILVNRQNSNDDSQTGDKIENIVNENTPSDDTGAAILQLDNDSIENIQENKNKENEHMENHSVSKLPQPKSLNVRENSPKLQPKSQSMRENSPKLTLVPKSQSMKSNVPKPPVAPKPNKSSVSEYNAHYMDPEYSEVGANLVGQDVVDGADKINLYQRPLSPIYSKIQKKYIVPNTSSQLHTSMHRPFKDGEVDSQAKVKEQDKEKTIIVESILDERNNENDSSSSTNTEHSESINAHEVQNSVSPIIPFSDKNVQLQEGENDNEQNGLNQETSIPQSESQNGIIPDDAVQDAVAKSSVSKDIEIPNSGPKSSMIPGPSLSHVSSIPKRTNSPMIKNKQSQGNIPTSIPKSNVPKLEKELNEESVQDQKSKPERPSRPPNVARHSSMTSPSPSRLPKIEKSKSLRDESPIVGRKNPKSKSPKDGSRIPSAIPISPKHKQKAPTPPNSKVTSSSKLPRMNGVVSPKPKRPPPPKSPPPNHTETNHMPGNDVTTNQNGGLEILADSHNSQLENYNNSHVLKKAIASYTAQHNEELSFQEGTFITPIGKDKDSGMCIGMLPDGQTGLYPSHYVQDSVTEQHSVV